MDNKKETTDVAVNSEGKKKPGRKPMTAAEKEAAAKVRAEEKAKAENLKPEFVVQFQGSDVDLSALEEEAKADFRKTKKRTLVTDMKLYVKPEERMAYYGLDHTRSKMICLRRYRLATAMVTGTRCSAWSISKAMLSLLV